MNQNPVILSPQALAVADNHTVLVAMYNFIVAAVDLAYALLIFYCVWRFLAWFLPKYWYRSKE